jgi:hypothetical protein
MTTFLSQRAWGLLAQAEKKAFVTQREGRFNPFRRPVASFTPVVIVIRHARFVKSLWRSSGEALSQYGVFVPCDL